jgi:hypothetical protein
MKDLSLPEGIEINRNRSSTKKEPRDLSPWLHVIKLVLEKVIQKSRCPLMGIRLLN